MLRAAGLFLAPFGALLAAGWLAVATDATQDAVSIAFRAAPAPQWRAPDDAWRDWLGTHLSARDLPAPVGPLHRWPDKMRWGHRPRPHVDVVPGAGNAVHVTHIEPAYAARLALLAQGARGRVATLVRAAGWLGMLSVIALPFLARGMGPARTSLWPPLLAGAVAAASAFLLAV